MKTVAIANQKGGCGKTTTAINLAGALAAIGKRILLIDLDPQSHASYGLGVTTQTSDRSIYNVLTESKDRQRPLTDCVVNAAANLNVVPSSILLSTLEQELKDKEDAVSKLFHVISVSDLKYDYIIIDCPPSLGFLTFNALRAADHILVPIDMSAFSLMGVAKLLGMLELIKLKISHAPRVNALATLYDRRTKYSEVMLTEIRSFFKDQMLGTIIRLNVALKKAVAKGVNIFDFDRDSNGAMDYAELAQELLRAESDLDFEKAMAEVSASRGTQKDSVMLVSKTIIEERVPADEKEKVIPVCANESVSRAAIAVSLNTDNTAPAREAVIEAVGKEALKREDALKDIQFAIRAPDAKDIYLVGDFNSWKADDNAKMSRLDDGRWVRLMGLTPGKYKYKFIIDGRWEIDCENSDKELNNYGTFDSIIKL